MCISLPIPWRCPLRWILLFTCMVTLASCGSDSPQPTSTASDSDSSLSTPTSSGSPDPGPRPTLSPAPGTAESTTGVEPAGIQSTDQFTVRSASLDDDGNGWVELPDVAVAVHMAFADYSWPVGFELNPETVLQTFTGGQAMSDSGFEVGFEHLLLGRWHTCVWYEAWLTAFANGDDPAEQEALEMIVDVLPENPSIHPESVHLYEARAERAAFGDPALIQQFVDVNCGRIDLSQYYGS